MCMVFDYVTWSEQWKIQCFDKREGRKRGKKKTKLWRVDYKENLADHCLAYLESTEIPVNSDSKLTHNAHSLLDTT